MPPDRFLVSLVVVGLAACTSDPSTTTFGAAFARAGCGPADGPAVVVELSESPKSDPLTPPLIQVSVYQSRNQAAGKTWSLEPPYTIGYASSCATATSCESATRGTIRFDPIRNADFISGTLDATFPTKGTVRGSFRAAWRTGQVICG